VLYKSWRLYPYRSHRSCNYVSCFSFPSSTLPTALLKQCMPHTVKSFHDLISCSMMTSRVSCSTPFLSGSQVLRAAKIDSFHFGSVTNWPNHDANITGNTEIFLWKDLRRAQWPQYRGKNENPRIRSLAKLPFNPIILLGNNCTDTFANYKTAYGFRKKKNFLYCKGFWNTLTNLVFSVRAVSFWLSFSPFYLRPSAKHTRCMYKSKGKNEAP